MLDAASRTMPTLGESTANPVVLKTNDSAMLNIAETMAIVYKQEPTYGTNSTPTIPGDQNDGGGKIEVLGLSAALGGGYGAHLAIQAGAASGGAAIATYGAAFTGVGAAALAGWEAGGLIGEIPAVKAWVDYATEVHMDKANVPEGLGRLYKMGEFPDGKWRFEPKESTPKEVWWYVPEMGDRIAGTGDRAYSSPAEAIENAGIDYAGEGGGASLIAILGIYHDAARGTFDFFP